MNIKKGECPIANHIIIDEGSMVTTDLFYRLLQAIENKPVNITIVGDCNQLPPIGWGNLMRELMNSNRIPLFYLTTNHRIKSNTTDKYILENANNLIDKSRAIKKTMEFKQGDGFYILPGGMNTVSAILEQLYKAKYDVNDILILSPYKAYLNELNLLVQNIFLDSVKDSSCELITLKYEQQTVFGTKLWCVGDRVMMTRNDYEINVMNGEEGILREITDDGLKVEFKDTIHLFKFDSGKVDDKDDDPEDAKKEDKSELLSTDLMHSFAVSVHKSQGSESKYVIIYIPENRSFSDFLNINLLYTAITRTKNTLWIVSSSETLNKIASTPLIVRSDGLAEKLRKAKNIENEKILEPLVMVPEFTTSLQSTTALTYTPSDMDDPDFMDDDLLYDLGF
jgi:exodeoxyribonuclease V alpha subunit